MLMDRYDELCKAAREGRIRYEAICDGESQRGFESHREAESWGIRRWGLAQTGGRHFRVKPYVLEPAA